MRVRCELRTVYSEQCCDLCGKRCVSECPEHGDAELRSMLKLIGHMLLHHPIMFIRRLFSRNR